MTASLPWSKFHFSNISNDDAHLQPHNRAILRKCLDALSLDTDLATSRLPIYNCLEGFPILSIFPSPFNSIISGILSSHFGELPRMHREHICLLTDESDAIFLQRGHLFNCLLHENSTGFRIFPYVRHDYNSFTLSLIYYRNLKQYVHEPAIVHVQNSQVAFLNCFSSSILIQGECKSEGPQHMAALLIIFLLKLQLQPYSASYRYFGASNIQILLTYQCISEIQSIHQELSAKITQPWSVSALLSLAALVELQHDGRKFHNLPYPTDFTNVEPIPSSLIQVQFLSILSSFDNKLATMLEQVKKSCKIVQIFFVGETTPHSACPQILIQVDNARSQLFVINLIKSLTEVHFGLNSAIISMLSFSSSKQGIHPIDGLTNSRLPIARRAIERPKPWAASMPPSPVLTGDVNHGTRSNKDWWRKSPARNFEFSVTTMSNGVVLPARHEWGVALRDLGAVSAPSIPSSVVSHITPLTNEIVPWRIEQVLDARTTCMLRNIPNKYTQKMLIDFLNETHRGCYDFVYLRMDFKNRCNVGYAFINFIDPKDIISFSKLTKGMKWARFNTSKVCDLTYANIQGKDALIRKFRNSSVMNAEPEYQPRIFYSSGPMRGLDELFPLPDRKQSALFEANGLAGACSVDSSRSGDSP